MLCLWRGRSGISYNKKTSLPTNMKSQRYKRYCVSLSISIPLGDLAEIEEYSMIKNLSRSDACMKIIRLGIMKLRENIADEDLKGIMLDQQLDDAKKRLKKSDETVSSIINEGEKE